MLPNSSAIVTFPADTVNVQYASSSLPRRAVRSSYLMRGCCRYRQFRYSALRTVHMPSDEPTLSASSEYSDVQGVSSRQKSRPSGPEDLPSLRANRKFTALATGALRLRSGRCQCRKLPIGSEGPQVQ